MNVKHGRRPTSNAHRPASTRPGPTSAAASPATYWVRTGQHAMVSSRTQQEAVFA